MEGVGLARAFPAPIPFALFLPHGIPRFCFRVAPYSLAAAGPARERDRVQPCIRSRPRLLVRTTIAAAYV